MGFDKAYILNQYELDNESKVDLTPEAKKAILDKIDKGVFTIQLKATQNHLDIDKTFTGIEGVSEIKTNDGMYKYYCGEFRTLTKAKNVLLKIKKFGFEDAFIRNLYLLITK